ncbi:MAG TPA: cyclic nucleotide-binding domain-containing protein, partial [Nitrospirae bacterium]|nr:cyclic nucleotide-binding domain-containing protein [Nitrospirota bacterium]
MDDNLKKAILELKDECKIFCLMDDAEMEQVIPYFEAVNYPAGSVLFNEGDTGSFIGFVRSGKLEVKKETEFKGRQIVLAVLGKGSFVGELSILDEQPRSATVVALEDSKLFLLKRDALDS